MRVLCRLHTEEQKTRDKQHGERSAHNGRYGKGVQFMEAEKNSSGIGFIVFSSAREVPNQPYPVFCPKPFCFLSDVQGL